MPDELESRQAEEQTLLKQLEALQRQEQLVTHKKTRAGIRYEISLIQWRLGLITDEEFREVEDFYQNFTYEWD